MRAALAGDEKSGGMAAALHDTPPHLRRRHRKKYLRRPPLLLGAESAALLFRAEDRHRVPRFPHYFLMHADYPPLLPLVYTWCSIAAHRFSYWGAAFLTPLYLLATVLAFRGFAAQKLGESTRNAFAALLAAVLAFGFAEGQVAGGADPQLIMFEVIAVAALTFAPDAHVIAAIALAGAAFTKVEGAAFAVVVVVALHRWCERDWRRALVLTAPAAVLLGSWIAFARHHGLLDSYGQAEHQTVPGQAGPRP